MEIAKRLENDLQQHICFLKNQDKSVIFRSASDESGTLKFIKETLQLARDYHAFLHFSRCVSLVEDIIEIFISHGREVKKQLIFSLVEILVDEVICEQTAVFCKMEVTRVLNILLEGCSLKVTQELLKIGKLNTKIKQLFSEIWLLGDFEMQVMLIECLLRLLPQKKFRENFFQGVVPEKLLSSFLDIRDSHFDVDCRKFLNKFNMTDEITNTRIFSFPVENVKLDGEQLFKPDDEGYDNFWMDFNLGSQRISIFCQSTLLPSQLSQGKETRWETLSFRAEDIKQYSCDAKNKLWVLRIELKVNAQMLTNKGREEEPHLFVCHLSKIYDVQTALRATLKKDNQKASVPQSLLVLPSKDTSLFSQEDSHEITSKQSETLIADSKSNPDVPNSQRDNAGQKSSVPQDLMSIVTSSLSSTDGSRYIPWQKLHNYTKKKSTKIQCNNPDPRLKFDSTPKSKSNLDKKNTIKKSIPNCSTEPESNKLSLDMELTCNNKIKQRSDDKNVPSVEKSTDHLSKADNVKEKYSVKPKIAALGTHVLQSPVTASGDYICYNSKPGLNKRKEKTSKEQKGAVKSSVTTECKTPHNPVKSKKKDVTVSDVFDKENNKCQKKSICLVKETMVFHSDQKADETSSRTRKSSIRSGTKRALIPVVSFKPETPKINKRSNLKRVDSKEPEKILSNYVETDLPLQEVSAVGKNSLQIADHTDQETDFQSKGYPSKNEKQSSDVTTSKENVNRNELFDDFKSPKSVDKIKKLESGRKSNRKKQGSKKTFEEEKELNLRNRETLNDSTENHQKINEDYPAHNPQDDKFLKAGQEHFVTVLESDLSTNQLKKNSDHKSMDSNVMSSESGELFVEIDAKSKTKEIQEHVCETQIDNVNDSISVDGETDDIYIQSSNVLKLSHVDTQPSSNVIGSYVFTTKNHDGLKKTAVSYEGDKKQTCPTAVEQKVNSDLGKKSILDRTNDDTVQAVKDQKKSDKPKIMIPINSSIVTSPTDILFKGLDTLNSEPSSNKLNCKKNLRPRNKNVCYTECDSTLQSNSTTDEKNTIIFSKQTDKRKKEVQHIPRTPKEDFLFSSMNYENYEPPALSSGGSKFNNTYKNSLKHEESFKIKRNLNNYTIWRSQEIKTTVTKLPMNGDSDCDLSDPYNFDSECLARLKESKSFPSFTSNIDATQKSSLKEKHRKSKKHHVQRKSDKALKDAASPEYTSFQKSRKLDREKDKKSTTIGKSHKRSSIQSKTLNASDGFTPAKRVKRNNALESYEGGLVFPPLDDSIPCTPVNDVEDNVGCDSLYSIESKSFGTQHSWIAKVKTSPKRRKQMRGKTYGQKDQNYASLGPQDVSRLHNKVHAEHEEERQSDDGSESDSKYKSLDYLKRSDCSEWTEKKGNPAMMRKGPKGKEKAMISTVQANNKTLFNEKQKAAKRKLSFEEKGKEEKRKRCLETRPMQSSSTNFSKDLWDLSSTKNANKLKSSVDNTERKKIPKDYVNESGPSSTRRLSKSALKRKYYDVSSASVTELSLSDSPEETSYRSPRLIPKKLFDSDMKKKTETNMSTRSKKTNKSNQRSCLNEQEQTSNRSLLNDEENYNPCKNNKSDTNFVTSNKTTDTANLKSKQTCEKQKTISTSMKRKAILKSNNDFDKSSLHLSSSPEIARDCVKRIPNSPHNKSLSLDLGMTLYSPFMNDSSNSPLTPSPLQSPQISISTSAYKNKPGSYYSHGSIRNHLSMYSDARTKDEEDYGGPYRSLHHLIQMEKMNSITQGQASRRWPDTQPDIMRSVNYMLKSSCKGDKEKRLRVIKEFDRCLQSLMYKTEKLWNDSKEMERKAMLLWSQQRQRIEAFREFSNQSLDSLKSTCDDLVNEMTETQTTQDKVKKSVKSALKKDFDALTNNIKTRYNEHSLEAMRHCLQASFMLI